MVAGWLKEYRIQYIKSFEACTVLTCDREVMGIVPLL